MLLVNQVKASAKHINIFTSNKISFCRFFSMKRTTTTLAFMISIFSSFAQHISPGTVLVRHDTTVLKAEECEWIIKSLTKNDPALAGEFGKSIPMVLLQAIHTGKLKAFDWATNKAIPSAEIYTWQRPVDTVAVYNDQGEVVKYTALPYKRRSEGIHLLRIYQDWYFDLSSAMFLSVINWIELLEEVHSSSGLLIGSRPVCRIYY